MNPEDEFDDTYYGNYIDPFKNRKFPWGSERWRVDTEGVDGMISRYIDKIAELNEVAKLYENDTNKGRWFENIDDTIENLDVEEYIGAIKESGVWSVRGFKQEDLDAILMLNIDPTIMKLFLTFSLGKLGQERVLSYLNEGN